MNAELKSGIIKSRDMYSTHKSNMSEQQMASRHQKVATSTTGSANILLDEVQHDQRSV
jgi:hypothetical protein